MIQGIQLDFSSDDLKAHITGRQNYHQKKADWYEQQVGSLTAGGVHENANASNDPVNSLKRSISDHQQKADFFRVMGEHVVPNETYRLSQNDLSTLELISRYY